MIKLEIKNYILNNCNKVKINSQDIIKGGKLRDKAW